MELQSFNSVASAFHILKEQATDFLEVDIGQLRGATRSFYFLYKRALCYLKTIGLPQQNALYSLMILRHFQAASRVGITPVHWYTLTPFEQQSSQDLRSTGLQKPISSNDLFPPNGHLIVAALRNLIQSSKIVLRGPFFCRNNTLYFPSPLTGKTAQALIPAAWLTAQPARGAYTNQAMLWDKRKPAPLVTTDKSGEFSPEHYSGHFLPYSAILQRLRPHSSRDSQISLKDASAEQPLAVEPRWRSLAKASSYAPLTQRVVEQTIELKSGWKLAIALDEATHQKLKQLGEVLLIHLGETQHGFWLESKNDPFQQQWRMLQKQSAQNRRMAERQLAQQAQTARVLAYLITPGVFERKCDGVATCRNFPWEWDLAYPADRNQPRGPLVSLVTTNPLQINGCCLSTVVSQKEGLSVQVYAAPAGSVYYLEYPARLFQDQPFLPNGKPNKVHIWRQLGYSEILWMPYQNRDVAAGT